MHLGEGRDTWHVCTGPADDSTMWQVPWVCMYPRYLSHQSVSTHTVELRWTVTTNWPTFLLFNLKTLKFRALISFLKPAVCSKRRLVEVQSQHCHRWEHCFKLSQEQLHWEARFFFGLAFEAKVDRPCYALTGVSIHAPRGCAHLWPVRFLPHFWSGKSCHISLHWPEWFCPVGQDLTTK